MVYPKYAMAIFCKERTHIVVILVPCEAKYIIGVSRRRDIVAMVQRNSQLPRLLVVDPHRLVGSAGCHRLAVRPDDQVADLGTGSQRVKWGSEARMQL